MLLLVLDVKIRVEDVKATLRDGSVLLAVVATGFALSQGIIILVFLMLLLDGFLLSFPSRLRLED